ncbi:MAG: hypothetical protein HFH35_03595 [Eubacterium sp.]|nr:hypothetical protein [Eubacterium sp.]
MIEPERYAQLLEELLNGIDAGEFQNTDSLPAWYTYAHLSALLRFAGQVDGGKELYERIYDQTVAYGEQCIRNKRKNGEKMKVAFLVISAAEWTTDELYQLMDQNDQIEPYIAVCPLNDRDAEDALLSYQKTYRFFEEKGYCVKKTYAEETGTVITWEQNGGVPDLIVHLTPWNESLLPHYHIDQLPACCLNCYIPYGFYTANNKDGRYVVQFVYNKEFVNLNWRIYADSRRTLKGYQTYGLLHGKNVRCFGYCKMDYFYKKNVYSEDEIRRLWKIPEGMDPAARKKVIIAPHHSIRDDEVVSFSTFHKNLYFWIYLAKKYADQIHFVLKPHPNLRTKSIRYGLFRSYDAYDAYIREWEALANTRFVDQEEYLDLFETSDGMIMDSASFLAEYMYVDKPLLFLTKEEQAFSELGEMMLEGYAKAPGEDYEAIDQFLQNVILGGQDQWKEKRAEIRNKELDYQKETGCGAGENIYWDIVRGFGFKTS